MIFLARNGLRKSTVGRPVLFLNQVSLRKFATGGEDGKPKFSPFSVGLKGNKQAAGNESSTLSRLKSYFTTSSTSTKATPDQTEESDGYKKTLETENKKLDE